MEQNELQPVVFAEVAPSRDLWKGIELRLDQEDREPVDQPSEFTAQPAIVTPITARRRHRWSKHHMTGIAATLLIAVVAVLVWQQGGVFR